MILAVAYCICLIKQDVLQNHKPPPRQHTLRAIFAFKGIALHFLHIHLVFFVLFHLTLKSLYSKIKCKVQAFVICFVKTHFYILDILLRKKIKYIYIYFLCGYGACVAFIHCLLHLFSNKYEVEKVLPPKN